MSQEAVTRDLLDRYARLEAIVRDLKIKQANYRADTAPKLVAGTGGGGHPVSTIYGWQVNGDPVTNGDLSFGATGQVNNFNGAVATQPNLRDVLLNLPSEQYELPHVLFATLEFVGRLKSATYTRQVRLRVPGDLCETLVTVPPWATQVAASASGTITRTGGGGDGNARVTVTSYIFDPAFENYSVPVTEGWSFYQIGLVAMYLGRKQV